MNSSREIFTSDISRSALSCRKIGPDGVPELVAEAGLGSYHEQVMRTYDQHLHSRHSFDSKADPADNVQAAIDRGLSGLTFTEHYDTHPEEWLTSVYDHAKYSATIAGLREKFGDAVFVGKGIEVDFQAANLERIAGFLRGGGFDLVILSVHWSNGRPIHLREAWEGADASAVTRRYFVDVRDAVRHIARLHKGGERVFDCLGHMDFCKRYSQRFCGSVHVEEHMDVVEEILEACLEADLVPEVNTSTWRRDLNEPMPGESVVRRYAELGGTMMSLGSDSHYSKDVGADFEKALRMMLKAGISGLALFEGRERVVEAIEVESHSSCD